MHNDLIKNLSNPKGLSGESLTTDIARSFGFYSMKEKGRKTEKVEEATEEQNNRKAKLAVVINEDDSYEEILLKLDVVAKTDSTKVKDSYERMIEFRKKFMEDHGITKDQTLIEVLNAREEGNKVVREMRAEDQIGFDFGEVSDILDETLNSQQPHKRINQTLRA